MLLTQDTGHNGDGWGQGSAPLGSQDVGPTQDAQGEGRNSLGGAGKTRLRGGWVGWKENMEGRTEVREGVGKGGALREQGRGKETVGRLWEGSNSYTGREGR